METKTNHLLTATLLALLAASPLTGAHADTLYWKTASGFPWDSSSWSTVPGGPYTAPWVDGSDVVFEPSGTPLAISGPSASASFKSITANENVTLTPGGTLGTAGTMAPVTVANGKTLNFAAQALDTSVGTGFVFTGPGTLSLVGATYPGGFTINSGTVAVAGTNALGSGGVLTINGGTIRSSGTGTANNRILSGKFTGITVGGDFILGDLVNSSTLTFDAPIALGSTTRTLTVNSPVTFSGGAVISGGNSAVGLTKVGPGTLTLQSTNVNTFRGGLTIGGGALQPNYGGLATPENLIDTNNTVTFTYGAPLLSLIGKFPSTAVYTNKQTLGNVTFNNGRSGINVNAGVFSPNTNTFLLTLGTLNCGSGVGSGILSFTPAVSSGYSTITTTSDKDSTGVYGPRVAISTDSSTTYNWLTSSGSGPYTLAPYPISSYLTVIDNGATDSFNAYVTNSVTLNNSQTHNTLKVANASTLTLAAGVTLTLTGGGLLMDGVTSGTAASIVGGTITAGTNSNTSLYSGYNPYELVLTAFNIRTNIMTSVIADNGTNPVSFTITESVGPTGVPSYPIILGTSNTYSGTTTLIGSSTTGNNFRTIDARLANSGTASTFGSGGTIVLNGAIVRVGGSDSCDRPIALVNSSGFHAQANTVTLSGSISGSGNLSVDCDFGGILVLQGDNSFTGDVLFQTDGSLTLSHTNALKNATLNVTASGTCNLADSSLSYVVGGLKGSGTLNLGAGTLAVGNNNQPTLLSGFLNGAGGLTKIGNGTLTLASGGAYSGDTLVTSGTLALGGALSSSMSLTVAAAGTLDVSAIAPYSLPLGGTLKGNGTVRGALLVNGQIAPGSSIGTLTNIGDVTWNGSSFYPWLFELGSGNTADRLHITGNFLKGTGTSGTDFVFDFGGSTATGTFTLVEWTGTNAFSAADFAATNYTGSVSFQIVGNQLQAVIGSGNTPPVATNFTMYAVSGHPVIVRIVGGTHAPSDPDGDPLVLTAVTPTANASATTDGTNVTYTPLVSFTGADTYTYTVDDAHGGTATGTVTVNVSASSAAYNKLGAPSLLAPGQVLVPFTGIPYHDYVLDWTPSLSAPVSWTPMATNTASPAGAVLFTNTPASGQSFYRTHYFP
jgi:autotransporter-associated beta strand protein